VLESRVWPAPAPNRRRFRDEGELDEVVDEVNLDEGTVLCDECGRDE